MANFAILVGNSEYLNLNKLECCKDDVLAINDLLIATAKYENVIPLLNLDSAQLKERIRQTIDAASSLDEIFFYFSGHGFQHQGEFFFCATNFDAKRPNETGLSNNELHTLLRSAEANLVVKVIDACSSGALLVKSDNYFLPVNKQSFKNIIQIASCLDSQNALTGTPLSVFTEKFRDAALHKVEGAVYYSDIIDNLRDTFLENNSQTPHFISQGTGREKFVDSAKHFDELRKKLSEVHNAEIVGNLAVAVQPTSNVDILRQAEEKFASKDLAKKFIANLFDGLLAKAKNDTFFEELFESEVIEHDDFLESTARAFIIRVLSGEKRSDNFVTATIKREHKRNIGLGFSMIAAGLWGHPDEAVEHYDLHLNCSLERAQLKITLTPKFSTLKRFVLVVSCAPSLEKCYVLELLTQHPLNDWGSFDSEGVEVIRRWYKMDWTDSCVSLVDKIYDKLKTVVEEAIKATASALNGESTSK